jgi:hypothetical protein
MPLVPAYPVNANCRSLDLSKPEWRPKGAMGFAARRRACEHAVRKWLASRVYFQVKLEVRH